MPSFRIVVAIVGLVGLVGCASSEEEKSGNRSPIGKADLYGSCAANECGGQSAGGNCWCDDACLGNGDCCSNKATTCSGGLMFATYNAGLAHGAVPFADERVQPIVDELKTSPA